jgi:hypothetical protein
VTVLAELMVTVQMDPFVPEVEAQPVHPPKVMGNVAVAVRVTVVDTGTDTFAPGQVEPQLMLPADTVPLPVPDFATVSRTGPPTSVNAAVTTLAELIVKVHTLPTIGSGDRESHADQAESIDPDPAVPVSRTVVPDANVLMQATPQRMLAPSEMLPVPFPSGAFFTVSVYPGVVADALE